MIEPTQVANLPLNGWNYTQLLTLAPGVVTGNYQKTVLGGRGTAYSVSGNRAFGELFLLDNTNTTDYFGKSVGSSGVIMGILPLTTPIRSLWRERSPNAFW